jgi:hypothetical protein
LPQGLIVCTCRVKKRKREEKNKGSKKKRKKEAGTQTSFVKGSLEAFYKKIPCPTPSVGGDVMRKRQIGRNKEKKENRAKSKGTKRHKTKNKRKHMARSGQTDMRDIYPCAAVVVVYLFVSKWLGLGYALCNYPSVSRVRWWPWLCPVIKKNRNRRRNNDIKKAKQVDLV